MPETAVDENNPFEPRKDEIGRARQRLLVEAISVTKAVGGLTNDELGPSVFIPDLLHVVPSLFGG